MSRKKLFGVVIVAAAASSALTYVFGPKRVKVVEREKVVEKVVEVVRKNVRTVRVVTEKPTGEKVTREVIEDRSESESARRTETDKTRTVEKTPLARDWLVGGSYGLSDRSASLTIQRRVLGGLYVGGYVSGNTQTKNFLGGGLSFSVVF